MPRRSAQTVPETDQVSQRVGHGAKHVARILHLKTAWFYVWRAPWGEVVNDTCMIEVNKAGMHNALIFADRHDAVAMANFNNCGFEYVANEEEGAVTQLS